MATPFEGLLPLPHFDAAEILSSARSIAEFRRLRAEGHIAYVRGRDDGTFEIVDGGKDPRLTPPEFRRKRA
jgi:hypothetical protein